MTSIKLSKRLQTIADMVQNNAIIADIGCDHALLDIYLVQKKIVNKSYACDVKIGAINQAIKNIAKYNLSNKIETRLANGLNAINKKDNIDTIVISGLGDIKIIEILSGGDLTNIKNIVVQSNKDVPNIRKAITSFGYVINKEKLVIDDNIIYTVILFQKGMKKYTKKELYFGIKLEKDELYKKNILEQINSINKIISNLPIKNILKIIKLKLKLKKLKKEIHIK